jgi:ATP-dependent helicase HrpA
MNPATHDRPLTFPPELPISAYCEEIIQTLRHNQVVIVCGDTGSGKTTQLPKIALKAGRGVRGMIGCTQPRRLATLAMARRVAEEFGEEPGGRVGYQHRFESKLSKDTVVKFMTDGILLAETRHDRLFKKYDTLIIDEAHERSLNIDFLLGILKRTLPKRPELKIIISSATLDVKRFSAFFANAPIVTVPGRLYPIETRWRATEDADDADLSRQIANAVDELIAEGPGDILVFLPGERDIRDATEVLNGRRLPNTEIIPLLASLPAGEQQRAFKLSSNRRIILSTNVAETSVTLPGIRYVIDSGLARISRYNPRTQVQRLQIESISQASANQRKGRCGRLAPGICIRLYGEDDFKKRDDYTPPEILRSSLARVILTMMDLRLGDVETFPFIEPPGASMIRDGYRELELLDAIQPDDQRTDDEVTPWTLTRLGRELARMPIAPNLARILFAAHQEKNLQEALIVVASLECDDPRRRPLEKQAEADKCHARYLTPNSDFAAIIRLWRWFHDQTKGKSQTFTRKLCKENFLSYPKMRDWIDLREQLEGLCTASQLAVGESAGGDMGLHRALLAGLLGTIGQRDPDSNDYRGARGIRFALFPGSGLMKLKESKPAKNETGPRHKALAAPSRDWIMAGELVETARLYARTAACIDVAWIEPIAKRHCKYSYHSAQWDPVHGYTRVRERVTLFGLVLVESRTRDYSRINREEARAIFIREGLVPGAFPKPWPLFLAENLTRTTALLEAEAKTRQHGALFDPEKAFSFYDSHLPSTICSAHDLRQWLKGTMDTSKESARNSAESTNYNLPAEPCHKSKITNLKSQIPCLSGRERSLVMQDVDFPPAQDLSRDFPDSITLNGTRLALTYRNAPGERDDGVSCHVPASMLPMVMAWQSDWLVPGLLEEKIRWMIQVLPSKVRRLLQPYDETIGLCKSRLTPGRGPLANALADALYAVRALRVPTEGWREEACPTHLRMRFIALDEKGVELGNGHDCRTLVQLFAPEASSPAHAKRPESQWHRDHITSWDMGDLPSQVDVGKAGWPILHYPALEDKGESVSLRLFSEATEAAAVHEKGVCRLFALALGKECKRYFALPSLPRQVILYLSQLETSAAQLGQEIGIATLRETFTADKPAIRDEASFKARLTSDLPRLHTVHKERTRLVVTILETASELTTLTTGHDVQTSTAESILDQLAWLVFPGFAESTPTLNLKEIPRYLEACRIRIQRAKTNPAGDQRKELELAPVWKRYTDVSGQENSPRLNKPLLSRYRWLVEELRVSLFAQELKTPYPVSAKRLSLLWDELTAPA